MLISQRPTLAEESVNETRSRFVIEPLEPGFGYTLGNSLRRTLLSSIPGAAVTSIKIDGVLHEFSSIQGVKEEVTAADIVPPADIDVINPELHLATLNTKAKLEMELRVEKGRGYRPAERNKSASDEIGRIPIDSIFSPVRRVSFTLGGPPPRGKTNKNRPILHLET